MDSRHKISMLLHNIEKVYPEIKIYHQAPPNMIISYPCIKYSDNNIDIDKANNINYIKKKSYTVTLISKNERTDIIEKILDIPNCNYDRSYISDNLYHTVFTIFFSYL